MRTFNLSAAKRGAKLTTRSGKSARFVGHTACAPSFARVRVYVDGRPIMVNEHGRFSNEPSPFDVFLQGDPAPCVTDVVMAGCIAAQE